MTENPKSLSSARPVAPKASADDLCLCTKSAPAPQSELVVELRNGLGNRLFGMLSAWVAADTEEVPVRFIWRSSAEGGLPCLFGDLFDTAGAPLLRVNEGIGENTDAWPKAVTLAKGFGREIKRGTALHVRVRTIINYDGLEEWQFFEEARERAAKLKVQPAVKEKLQIPEGDYIGLHVRFTDHLPSYVTTPRWVYQQAVITLLKSTSLPIWVCGDAPPLMRELQAMAPGRIFLSAAVSHGRTSDRASREGIEYALADILGLARARLILGAPQSTFNQLGSFLGGVKMVSLIAHSAMNQRFVPPLLWHWHGLQLAYSGHGECRSDIFTTLTKSSARTLFGSIKSPWYQNRIGTLFRNSFNKQLSTEIKRILPEHFISKESTTRLDHPDSTEPK